MPIGLEKTALLLDEGRWVKPHGATPTTHILKPQIGRPPNGIDLSNSVENEYYCLRLAAACGLPVASTEIHTFGATRALVIERFDRLWTRDGRRLRLPQEDCCQALVAYAIEELAERVEGAIASVGAGLPAGFPQSLHRSVSAAMIARLRSLRAR